MRNMHYEALSHLYEAANKVSADEFDGEELDIALNHARAALATTEPVMANGLTAAETDASASVVGLTK